MITAARPHGGAENGRRVGVGVGELRAGSVGKVSVIRGGLTGEEPSRKNRFMVGFIRQSVRVEEVREGSTHHGCLVVLSVCLSVGVSVCVCVCVCGPRSRRRMKLQLMKRRMDVF